MREWKPEHRIAVAEFLRGFDLPELVISRALVALQVEHAGDTEVCSHCRADLSARPVLSTVATAGFAALEVARRDLEFWSNQRTGPVNGDVLLFAAQERAAAQRKRAAAEVERLEKKTARKDPVTSRRVTKKPLQVVYRTSVEGSLGDPEALKHYPAISFRLCAPCAVKATDSGKPPRRSDP